VRAYQLWLEKDGLLTPQTALARSRARIASRREVVQSDRDGSRKSGLPAELILSASSVDFLAIGRPLGKRSMLECWALESFG